MTSAVTVTQCETWSKVIVWRITLPKDLLEEVSHICVTQASNAGRNRRGPAHVP